MLFFSMGKPLWVFVSLLIVCAFSSISNDKISAYVQSHNSRRCLHGASDLEWSESVENSAQTWANQCDFNHENQNTYGENLYAGSANPTSEQVLTGWYNDEIGSYDYGNPGFSSTTGHFTAVIWSVTSEVGCGICTTGSTYQYIVVCRYNPPGNVAGQFTNRVALVSKTAQECTADCGPPSRQGFDFTGCSNSFPGTCSPTCRPGYFTTSGSQRVYAICQSTGNWWYLHTCQPFTCPTNPTHTDPNVDMSTCASGTGVQYEGTCAPTCNTGYTGNPTAVCGLNAQWTFGGSCAPNSPCGAPSPSTGTICSNCGATAAGSTCSCTCATGYTGSPTATCGNNNQWTYPVSCTAGMCTPPPRAAGVSHAWTKLW